ncbi:MAG TPA: hypothetical protein VF074_06830 [Pyrinomonadaceae bacterium]
MSDPTIRVPNCPQCGVLASAGESYCRQCGKPLVAQAVAAPSVSGYSTPSSSHPSSVPTVTTVAPPLGPVHPAAPINVGRKRRSPLLLGCLVFLALSVVAVTAGGIYIWRKATYSAPERSAPAIPERAASTMTEFPVDNDTNEPATPTSVETEALGGTTTAKSDTASQTKLPPGVTRSGLAMGATSMTSATYRPKQKAPTTNSTSDSIYICVLTLMPHQQSFGDSLATSISREIGGQKTGVHVQSDTGFVYTGTKIRSNQENVYVLNKQGADILILIYSADPANQAIVDRLAQNVGNGQGLMDYPEVKNSLWTLPPSTPSGLTLVEISTMSRGQIEASLAGGTADDDMQKILGQMRTFIPARLTGAKYTDANRKEWVTMSFEYESTFQAWRTWLLARGALGLGGAQSTTVRDVDGLFLTQDGTRILVFQKGPYLIVLTGPDSASSDRLVGLGNLFQV